MDTTNDTLVATAELFVGTSRAANKGDIVHRETVEAQGWTDVAEHGTDEAREALGEDTAAAMYDGDDVEPAFDSTKASVEQVLERVGTDKNLAQSYLHAEVSRGQGSTRTTLVDKLRAIADA